MGMTAAVTGTLLSAGGKVYGAQKSAASADYSAAVLDQQAGQSVASGIQGSINERRKAQYVASAAQARAAASGGGATDPTVVDIIGNIQGEGEYRALTELYQGQDRATSLRARASGLRREASAERTSGWLSGISTVLSGGSSFYDKYAA
jgi:hypothetical protein